ncbi:MAG: helix-turn-helix transcriptional regulator [Ruminococcus sp.]|nr:helix-turn-helix transcriptional regulator [Ruminococcus sp.]
MNKDFPRIISLLRKEKGLSQKKVADDLDISQALLSHYEKGIRECGLDFLVKIASYYNVSCDYLLGRTPDRSGATITIEDIPEYNDNTDNSNAKDNMLAVLNKRLIMNTTSIIFDMLIHVSNKKLTGYVSNYLMNSNYLLFRKLYSSNNENPQAVFSIDKSIYSGYIRASMNIEEAKIDDLLNTSKSKINIDLTPEVIETEYKDKASSLYNLIQNSEKNIKQKL